MAETAYEWLQRESPIDASLVRLFERDVRADVIAGEQESDPVLRQEYRNQYEAGIDALSQRIRELLTPSTPSRAGPEWGEPRRGEVLGFWDVRAKCDCWLMTTSDGAAEGAHCPSHTFADLVTGESLLRAVMEKGEQG